MDNAIEEKIIFTTGGTGGHWISPICLEHVVPKVSKIC